MAEHNALTGTSLHWPRTIEASATSDTGKVVTPHGSVAGTGELRLLAESEISGKQEFLSVKITDISTAGTVYIPTPFAGTVTSIDSVIDGAIITVDCGITTGISGVNITNGAITIAFTGSAAGDLDSATPTALNTFTSTDYLEVTTDGASTNVVDAVILFTITRT